jgi:hypothetical protein
LPGKLRNRNEFGNAQLEIKTEKGGAAAQPCRGYFRHRPWLCSGFAQRETETPRVFLMLV